jgi:hypothetical protein
MAYGDAMRRLEEDKRRRAAEKARQDERRRAEKEKNDAWRRECADRQAKAAADRRAEEARRRASDDAQRDRRLAESRAKKDADKARSDRLWTIGLSAAAGYAAGKAARGPAPRSGREIPEESQDGNERLHRRIEEAPAASAAAQDQQPQQCAPPLRPAPDPAAGWVNIGCGVVVPGNWNEKDTEDYARSLRAAGCAAEAERYDDALREVRSACAGLRAAMQERRGGPRGLGQSINNIGLRIDDFGRRVSKVERGVGNVWDHLRKAWADAQKPPRPEQNKTKTNRDQGCAQMHDMTELEWCSLSPEERGEIELAEKKKAHNFKMGCGGLVAIALLVCALASCASCAFHLL